MPFFWTTVSHHDRSSGASGDLTFASASTITVSLRLLRQCLRNSPWFSPGTRRCLHHDRSFESASQPRPSTSTTAARMRRRLRRCRRDGPRGPSGRRGVFTTIDFTGFLVAEAVGVNGHRRIIRLLPRRRTNRPSFLQDRAVPHQQDEGSSSPPSTYQTPCATRPTTSTTMSR